MNVILHVYILHDFILVVSIVSPVYIRKHIGIVPQDVVLFNDTIEYNLKYGKLNATRDELINVTKAVQLYNVIVNNFSNVSSIEGYQ